MTQPEALRLADALDTFHNPHDKQAAAELRHRQGCCNHRKGNGMTRDDIIRMAREAGLFVRQEGIPENGALMRFAALVAAVEREACAKVCDARGVQFFSQSAFAVECHELAHAIRARSNT